MVTKYKKSSKKGYFFLNGRPLTAPPPLLMARRSCVSDSISFLIFLQNLLSGHILFWGFRTPPPLEFPLLQTK